MIESGTAQRLRFLAEASHVLASSLDVAVTLQQAARLTIPTLADACVMYLVDADGGAQATAVAHARPAYEDALWELQRRYPDPAGSRGALGRVLSSGESVCFPDSDPVARLARARDQRHRELLEQLDTHSAMIVPMVARGQVIGALSLMTSVSGRRYTDEDVSFAEDLARRCALAVDNARLYEAAQREIAQRRRVEQQLASLQAVSAELAATLDPAALAEIVVRELATRFGYELPSVYFLAADGTLQLAAERGYDRPISTFRPESGVVGRVRRTLAPSLVEDVRADLEYTEAAEGVVAEICVPILRAKDLLGIVNVETRRHGVLGQHDTHLLSAMAEMVAVALENARLFRAAQEEIAERKRAEAALAELTRTKEELISMISHELRSPASVLIGYAELLAADATSADERHEMANAMVQQGRQLTKLIDDFLEVHRNGRSELRVDPKPMDLRPLIDRVAMATRSDSQHVFELQEPEAVLMVNADESRVEQALMNLLNNARKYSPGGGTIRLAAVRRDGFVEISVTDDGLGIPREALPRVFDRYYRVETEDRRGISGTGLGLAVVRELVHAQGGRIGVESEGRGKGSRFWFTLPCATVATGASDAPIAKETKQSAGTHLRVLAVDDEPAIGAMLRRLLRADGHAVDYATSATDALERLTAENYDVVVSDLTLGGELDGLDLAERVRRGWPAVRFVLASGSVDLDLRNARERGARAILQKPYQLDELRRALGDAA